MHRLEDGPLAQICLMGFVLVKIPPVIMTSLVLEVLTLRWALVGHIAGFEKG